MTYLMIGLVLWVGVVAVELFRLSRAPKIPRSLLNEPEHKPKLPLWRQWEDTADALEEEAQAAYRRGMPRDAAIHVQSAKAAFERARELKAEWDAMHPKADHRPPLVGTTYRQQPTTLDLTPKEVKS